MKPFTLEAKTISDAWFQLLWNIFGNSYRQDIQSGSFEKEQYRLQFPGVSIYIEHPDQDIVPVIPSALGIPSPTTMEYIEDYFANYLMDPSLGENETYKYSSRIHHFPLITKLPQRVSQFGKVIEMLTVSPLTNQAIIEVGSPEDLAVCIGNDGKLDPPCLRLLDFKVIPVNCDGNEQAERAAQDGCAGYKLGEYGSLWKYNLTLSCYFRSWDLWAGFPTNLGGLELLKQFVADTCGLANGPMYAYSSGLHIYGYQEEIARIRTMKTIEIPHTTECIHE